MYFHKPQEKPQRWGNFQSIQHAVMKNCEKIYGVDSNSLVLAIPCFWGLPALDYSRFGDYGDNYGAIYKNEGLYFGGSDQYVQGMGPVINDKSFTIISDIKPANVTGYQCIFQVGASASQRYGIWLNNAKLLIVSDGYNATLGSYAVLNQCNQFGVVHRYGVDNRFYVDGQYKEATANLAGPTIAVPTVYRIGIRSYDLLYDYTGTVYSLEVFDVELSDAQMSLIGDLPWALYQPVSRPVYFFQAAAGGVAPTSTIYGPLYGPFAGCI